ncbi:MAG: hypothetical protein KDJ37_16560 [Hyphomicrobiaceae bacterium]|nr:hypothetical protein [Hyphomicrobiaceae bacterium]
MGIGKYILLGLGGFCAIGLVSAQFADPIPPEKDLEFGKSHFASQCEQLTRNRKINGRFGRGHAYCTCIMGELETVLNTGDEFRYANALHDASGSERWLLEKTRMKHDIDQAREKFTPIIGPERIYSIDRDFFEMTVSCARSM